MSTPKVDMSNYDQLGCLHDLFTKQALRTPKKVAVVNCDGVETTFQELDEMTNLLASKLLRCGLGKHKVGGILMERCLEYTVAYIAILKAGAAYMPVEVSWPTPLTDSVLEDVCPSVICTKDGFYDKVKHSAIPLINLSGNWLENLKKEQQSFPLVLSVGTSLDDTAYVVYSSGTTGKPKGIVCPHRGAVFSYTWRHLAYPYQDGDREACNVFFVWEMLRPLAKGVPMYVIPDDVIYDPPKLADFLDRNKITRMLFTPSLLQAMLEFRGLNLKSSLKHMRQIIYCGEVVTTVLRDKVATLLPWIQQLNLYSISECHDVANADLSDLPSPSSREFCPVGMLLPGVRAVVMDQQHNVKPVGEPGEIYIGGPTLAIGYLNRPELNAARFISCPGHVSGSVGERLYRTGDWGYVLSDGSLEICGRCDTMVKIRGYTVELEAVKTNLMELPTVSTACVQAFGPEGSDKTLIAFIAAQENSSLSSRELRSQLKKRLPFYMIPSRFIILDRIPVMEATGKLNTIALEALYSELKDQTGKLEVTKSIEGHEEPVMETELAVAHIWSELLNLFILDTEESFFDFGGHSLLAAALTSKLNDKFNVNLSTAHIFKNPTISSQAGLVSSSNHTVEKIDLLAEKKKLQIEFSGMDSSIRAFWQTMKVNPGNVRKGNVFLTGSTGYVGCFLLQQLLQHTQTTVYCLVRDSPDASPLQRIEEARQQFGLRKFVSTDRVIPLKGDVSLTNLGLSKDLYSALSVDVDVIIHAAAQVNLILPYSALYMSNVLGTFNVLQFAINAKIKPVHYISTNAVFPGGLQQAAETADMTQYCGELDSGYGQTKWLAEQLVLSAANKGFPSVVYRCGNVGGSRLVSGWNPSDFIFHMIRGVVKTGVAPEINWQIELTPVDFVSQGIIHLTCDLHDSVGKVFHFINNSTLSCKTLWKILNDVGYSITTTSYQEWRSLIMEKGRVDSQLSQLSQLLENLALDEAFFSSTSTYCQANLTAALKKMNTTYPELTSLLFKDYIDGLSGVGAIPRPKQKRGFARDNKSLAGKVVLVTGASSGIGEGIARTLALAGATVVLAARRLNKLEALAKDLQDAGAGAYPVKMDVCDPEQVAFCIEEVESKIGAIDVLVNNAGVMYYQFITKCDLPRWHHMVDVNIKGPLNCVAAVLGRMLSRGSGFIVNISSDGSRKPFAGLAVYCGTKYFLRCFSGAMRAELASSGVKVCDIQPGDVVSELHQHATDPEAELAYDWSAKVQILKPADVGEAVLYALSQPSHCAINEILLEPELLPLS